MGIFASHLLVAGVFLGLYSLSYRHVVKLSDSVLRTAMLFASAPTSVQIYTTTRVVRDRDSLYMRVMSIHVYQGQLNANTSSVVWSKYDGMIVNGQNTGGSDMQGY